MQFLDESQYFVTWYVEVFFFFKQYCIFFYRIERERSDNSFFTRLKDYLDVTFVIPTANNRHEIKAYVHLNTGSCN